MTARSAQLLGLALAIGAPLAVPLLLGCDTGVFAAGTTIGVSGLRGFRAIRLFQNPSGWTPHYTQSGVDRNFQPVCFGPAYIRPAEPIARM